MLWIGFLLVGSAVGGKCDSHVGGSAFARLGESICIKIIRFVLK